MREVALDRSVGHEQCLGDLSVREAGGCEFGDPTFASCERFKSCEPHAPGLRPGSSQFGLCSFGKCSGTEVVRRIDCCSQQVTRVNSMVSTAQERSKVGLCASLLEASIGAFENIDRLTQEGLSFFALRDEACGSKCHAEAAWCAEGTGQLDLFLTEQPSTVAIAQCEVGQRRIRTPREIARTWRKANDGDLPDEPEVTQRLGKATLG
jgi:hypothetical protein